SDPQYVEVEIGVAPGTGIRLDGMIPTESELVQNSRREDVDPLPGPGRGIHFVGLGKVRIGGRLRAYLAVLQPAHEDLVIHHEVVVYAPEILVRSNNGWHIYLDIVVQRVCPVEHGQGLVFVDETLRILVDSVGRNDVGDSPRAVDERLPRQGVVDDDGRPDGSSIAAERRSEQHGKVPVAKTRGVPVGLRRAFLGVSGSFVVEAPESLVPAVVKTAKMHRAAEEDAELVSA